MDVVKRSTLLVADEVVCIESGLVHGTHFVMSLYLLH